MVERKRMKRRLGWEINGLDFSQTQERLFDEIVQ